MCSDAPDMTAANLAAQATAQLGKESFEWYKQQYAAGAPARERAAQTAQQVSDAQLASLKQNDALAAEYADYNRNTFRPLEQGIVADAEGYDTPEKRQAAAGAAMADVNKGFAATNAATARQLAANGIDPGSTRAMSVMAGQGVDQAVANASAAYKARQGVETQGFARKMDAASLGRNLASNQATSARIAQGAGNSAVGNAQVPLAVQQQATDSVGQGYQSAIGANTAAGNLYTNIAKTQAQDGSGAWGALGSLGGAAISKWSDVNLKKDFEIPDEEQALEQVTATPVSNWKYDPAKMAVRGIEMQPGDEAEHTGPMAQDVAATMGEQAAPGGKKIDLVTMNGKTMLAVQALNKKVDKLAAMIGSGELAAGGQA